MSEQQTPPGPQRGIRSFVLRGGRLTTAQSRAMEELWPRFGIEPSDEPVNIHTLFDRQAPLVVEVGFGNGEATWQMATAESDKNFIGIEVHPPGVGHLLLRIEEHDLNNIRIANTDAVEFIRDRLPASCMDELRIYFPDPWHKKRHHKRRLIQNRFLDLLAHRLSPGALLHIATDWQPYAEHMVEVFATDPRYVNQSDSGDYCPQPAWRPGTKYEQRGTRLGHRSFDLLYRFDESASEPGL